MAGKRGPYAKTAARRQEILDVALEAYAQSDGSGVPLRQIAEAVGLSEAGVLHHFGSREALLTAILAERDIADSHFADDFADLIRHNMSTPGLVKLFVQLAAAAAETGHAAHEFFRERAERFRAAAEQGLVAKGVPADEAAWRARVLIAAVDGIQIQWLLDPTIDMAADIVRLDALLSTPPPRP
jgi:AcrR family transcriptional regulator